MAIPGRAFVGMVVFGLIASLAIVPYTLLILGGYTPPPDAPYQAIFPPQHYSPGDKIMLVLASAFSIAVTIFAWRGLLARAREDRLARAHRQAERDAAQGSPPPPPGYQ